MMNILPTFMNIIYRLAFLVMITLIFSACSQYNHKAISYEKEFFSSPSVLFELGQEETAQRKYYLYDAEDRLYKTEQTIIDDSILRVNVLTKMTNRIVHVMPSKSYLSLIHI